MSSEKSLDQRYYLSRPDNPTWFENALLIVLSHLGADPRFSGQVKITEGSLNYNLDADSKDLWISEITKNWSHIIYANC